MDSPARGKGDRQIIGHFPAMAADLPLSPGLSATEIDGSPDYLLQESNLVPSVRSARPGLSDPDDEMVLDLATQIGAAILPCN